MGQLPTCICCAANRHALNKLVAVCRAFIGYLSAHDTNHEPTINLYRRARDLKGIKKILIASGVRYDIAVEDPRYIKELATHHVGGYLKIAPEHTEEGPLSKMMKPAWAAMTALKSCSILTQNRQVKSSI